MIPYFIIVYIRYAYYVIEETSVSRDVYVNPQPFPGCTYCPSGPVWKCTSYHICIIREVGRSFQNPVGTCRMGGQHRTDVVVDERLRVRGVSGLRVIDTSVFPAVINANTNAAALAVGEKGADLVLEDHRTQFGNDPGYEQSWSVPVNTIDDEFDKKNKLDLNNDNKTTPYMIYNKFK